MAKRRKSADERGYQMVVAQLSRDGASGRFTDEGAAMKVIARLIRERDRLSRLVGILNKPSPVPK